MKKSPKQKLTEENDKIWSLLVRIRDMFTCQLCGKSSKHVEAAHVFGRSNKNTRWNTRNGIAVCYYCHRFKLHGGRMSEGEKVEFFKKHLGKFYEILDNLRKQPVRFDTSFVLAWNSALRAEFLNLTGMTYEEFLRELKNDATILSRRGYNNL